MHCGETGVDEVELSGTPSKLGATFPETAGNVKRVHVLADNNIHGLVPKLNAVVYVL